MKTLKQKVCRTKRMLDAYDDAMTHAKCDDNGQMQEDMFIMMP